MLLQSDTSSLVPLNKASTSDYYSGVTIPTQPLHQREERGVRYTNHIITEPLGISSTSVVPICSSPCQRHHRLLLQRHGFLTISSVPQTLGYRMRIAAITRYCTATLSRTNRSSSSNTRSRPEPCSDSIYGGFCCVSWSCLVFLVLLFCMFLSLLNSNGI
jgi:hypothetical protein